MTGKNGWAGKINNLRLDIFDGPSGNAGDSVTYSMIAFAKTEAEAQKLAEGYVPEGCIADFGAFKQKLTDTLAAKKEIGTVLTTAQTTATDAAALLEAAKESAAKNDQTAALYSEAEALVQKINTSLDAIKTANTSAEPMTNQVAEAQALLAQAKDALTALQADAQTLTSKLEELREAAAETEPPTTEEPTEQPTEQPTEPQPDQQKGCKSAMTASFLLLALLSFAAIISKKRR